MPPSLCKGEPSDQATTPCGFRLTSPRTRTPRGLHTPAGDALLVFITRFKRPPPSPSKESCLAMLLGKSRDAIHSSASREETFCLSRQFFSGLLVASHAFAHPERGRMRGFSSGILVKFRLGNRSSRGHHEASLLPFLESPSLLLAVDSAPFHEEECGAAAVFRSSNLDLPLLLYCCPCRRA